MKEHPNGVLTIGGKIIANRDSATRPKRQIIAHAIILREELGDFICLGKWTDLRLSHGHTTDRARSGHVPLQQDRRYGEGVPYVVESMVHFVDREQRFPVDVDRKQVPNCIGVFGAIETMNRRPARVRFGGGRTVEFGFQVSDQEVIAGRVWPGFACRRHRARPKLVHYFFPHRRVFAGFLEIHFVEHQPRCRRLLVVARDAICIQKCAVC